ncbi:copper homeostasis protein CutC [Stieleria varia]|uniref:PF03932 family protein CutC n=1 Tax=Stieleria varia TaxID=2528005 RepID=A0A5C6B7F5_9BACT|nr:copper homeostasis protein CutC [Stieleria varia]TWU06434.1 Copper homeostasis protein CutC [Stieleria varia]
MNQTATSYFQPEPSRYYHLRRSNRRSRDPLSTKHRNPAEFTLVAQPRYLLEVCIASVDDAVAAAAGGADRLELNVALDLGGLTPSIGLLEEVKQSVTLPVVAMVRPRGAGFRFSSGDRKVMLRDADHLLSAGADGLVAGVLHDDGTMDLEFWRQLRRVTQGRQLVFHRAIDLLENPLPAISQLIDAGTDRVLTSGGCETAWAGRDHIARLRRFAGDRIEILAGAGVSPDNAVELVQATGCRQIHGSFREIRHDDASFVAPGNYPATNKHLVAATRAALDRIASI